MVVFWIIWRNVEFDFAAKSIKQACVRKWQKRTPGEEQAQSRCLAIRGNISFKNFGKIEKALR